MINTLCNGLNPSQVSLRLSLRVDTWDEFGPFAVMHLTEPHWEVGERRVPSYCCSWGGGDRKDGAQGWIWEGSRAAPALAVRSELRGGWGVGADVC